MEIKIGEVYEVGNENIIDGEIHLDGVNVNRWIEISKETLRVVNFACIVVNIINQKWDILVINIIACVLVLDNFIND